jgi:hypothetical protein
MFNDLWERQAAAMRELKSDLMPEVRGIDEKIRQLLDRIVEADSRTVIAA